MSIYLFAQVEYGPLENMDLGGHTDMSYPYPTRLGTSVRLHVQIVLRLVLDIVQHLCSNPIFYFPIP